MIEFEIDDKKVSVAEGGMIIEAADVAGIYIPRFCYHKKLSIAANCRMCLVEVEKSKKPLPACATPATAGMKVFTKSPMAVDAQKSVMEFLLINHPLDCPICDQGGECELQDLSLGYGRDISRYYEGKRSVVDENLGPLISTDMTRCIQCTRCVRFGKEVAGLPELGATNRGENLEISTYVHQTMRSELSGNVIDLCPVGALTSKPFRFTARAWELKQHASIAPHDCVGSNIFAHSRSYEYNDYRLVMRVVPRENELINETWIADRDRYSYEAVKSADRLLTPKIKRESQWVDVDWNTALNYVVERWQGIIDREGATQLGAIASPSSTCEEFFMLQKLFRALGSNNLDHRIRQLDFTQQENFPRKPELCVSFGELENLDTLFLIGSDTRKEQPLCSHRIRKAALNGTQVLALNPIDYEFNFEFTDKFIVSSRFIPEKLAKIAKHLLPKDKELAKLFPDLKTTKEDDAFANRLIARRDGLILLGAQAINHPQASLIRALAEKIAQATGMKLGTLSEGANAAGGWLTGMIPHRGPAGMLTGVNGANALEMLENNLKSYLLLNVEPELDFIKGNQAVQTLNQAEFVVALTPFVTEVQEQYADVLLPIAPFFETSGSFISACNSWQSFEAVTKPLGNAKPAWKIFRVLGNLFHLEGFDFVDVAQVRSELKKILHTVPRSTYQLELNKIHYQEPQEGLLRLIEWPMYHIDNIVRRAISLQEWALDENLLGARINENVAKQFNLKSGELISIIQNEDQLDIPVFIDNRIAGDYVFLAGGLAATGGFGEHMGPIKLLRGRADVE